MLLKLACQLRDGYLKENRIAFLLSFAEEHQGDERFYENLAEQGGILIHAARRKLFNPFKWLQFVARVFFATVLYLIYAALDIVCLPVSLFFNSCWYLGKHYLSQIKLSWQDFSDFACERHRFFVWFPKFFVLGNINFLKNPIDTLLSPINKVIHPLKKMGLQQRVWVFLPVIFMVAASIFFFQAAAFTFFSHISVLLFFPMIVNFILGFGGSFALEVVSGVVTCFNLMGICISYFNDCHVRQEKDSAAEVDGNYDPDETILGRIIREYDNGNDYHWLPRIYKEEWRGKSRKHYGLHKFFDIESPAEDKLISPHLSKADPPLLHK